MSKKNKLEVMIVLDRSGSMATNIDQTLKGVNAYVMELQKKGEKGNVSVFMFDDRPNLLVRDRVKLKQWKGITHDEYDCRGMTPLYDAIGESIHKLSASIKGKNRDSALVIMTDGYENCSTEFTASAVKDLISSMKKKSGLMVAYLGADHNSFLQARGIGIGQQDTISVSKSDMGATMSSYAANTVARSSGWTDEQRAKMESK